MSHGPSAIPPTNPYRIARAYGVQPSTQTRSLKPSSQPSVRRADAVAGAKLPSQNGPGIARLLAGRVDGGVDFSDGRPIPRIGDAVIPFYRHPADRNAAATNIRIGRTLDVSG